MQSIGNVEYWKANLPQGTFSCQTYSSNLGQRIRHMNATNDECKAILFGLDQKGVLLEKACRGLEKKLHDIRKEVLLHKSPGVTEWQRYDRGLRELEQEFSRLRGKLIIKHMDHE